MIATEYYEKEADENGHLYFDKYVITAESPRASFAHFHDSVEFIFVREGRYEAHVNGQNRLLCAGEFSFADSFSPHFYRVAGDAIVYAVVIDKKLFTGDPFSARVFAPFPDISAKNFAAVMRFFDCTEPLLSPQTKHGSTEIKTGFANLLSGMLYRFCDTQEKKENKTAKVFVEVLKYLNEHFREEITLSYLAAKFSYAENYFSTLFNDFTGMSLREYVNRWRIGEVLRVKARQGDRSLFSIALDCGFTSEKTFYRAYAKYKTE